MRPQSAKAKGRRFQQQVRDLWLETFAELLNADDIRSTSMGAAGDDLLLSPLARVVLPYSFELKKQQAPSLWEAFAQSAGRATDVPVAIFSCNNLKLRNALVALPRTHFFGLLQNVPHTYADLDRLVPRVASACAADVDSSNTCDRWQIHVHAQPTFNLWPAWARIAASNNNNTKTKAVLVRREHADLAIIELGAFQQLVHKHWLSSVVRPRMLPQQPVAAGDATDDDKTLVPA